MRLGVGCVLGLACAAGLFAAEGAAPAGRYSVAVDLSTYPQGTPKETLASVLKAAAAGKFEYLAAQLADPAFIDARVKALGGDFAEQVKDTQARLDPPTLKQLRRFLDDGDWTTGDAEASVRLKDLEDRAVFLRRIDGRWYMEHRSKPKG